MIKVKLYYYVVSGGDGSAYPKFFTTQEKRDAYMEAEENSKQFEGYCEADGEVEFEVDEIVSNKSLGIQMNCSNLFKLRNDFFLKGRNCS